MRLYAAIYQLAIYAYFAAIKIVSLFNGKAKLFIAGRKDLFDKMNAALAGDARQSIWMHCASLGEFEQGRPVLEALREQYPEYVLIVTFFSPSGYEVRKNYQGADHVFYLPLDTPGNATHLLDLFQPALCVFVKYELWYFYLSAIAARGIPAILISAIFNNKQGFFKWYGGLQRRMLHCFSNIFVQDKDSVSLLAQIGINKVTISGDTRFDRVIKAAGQTEPIADVTTFAAGHKLIIAGSTWKEDEIFLQKALKLLPATWKLVVVPHEVHAAHIEDIKQLFAGDMLLWSEVKANGVPDGRHVLVVDEVGFLLQLYRYGDVAWIGGGFGKDGVHNVLEAAVYGMPCFYGPVFHQFLEAKELIKKGGAFSVTEPADLANSLQQFEDRVLYNRHAAAAREYVISKGGATAVVMDYICKNVLAQQYQHTCKCCNLSVHLFLKL